MTELQQAIRTELDETKRERDQLRAELEEAKQELSQAQSDRQREHEARVRELGDNEALRGRLLKAEQLLTAMPTRGPGNMSDALDAARNDFLAATPATEPPACGRLIGSLNAPCTKPRDHDDGPCEHDVRKAATEPRREAECDCRLGRCNCIDPAPASAQGTMGLADTLRRLETGTGQAELVRYLEALDKRVAALELENVLRKAENHCTEVALANVAHKVPKPPKVAPAEVHAFWCVVHGFSCSHGCRCARAGCGCQPRSAAIHGEGGNG